MKKIIVSNLLLVLPLLAHHAGGHDTSKIVTIKGTVTNVQFINPHAVFYLDVAEPDGGVTNWAFEMGSVSGLAARRIGKGSFKQGDQVSVDAYPPINGHKFASALTLTLQDGRKLDLHDGFLSQAIRDREK
jgi:hypothetical protein